MQEVVQNNQPSILSNKLRDLLKVYDSQNKTLIDQGFVDEKLNLRTLRKCNGNIELATESIKSKLEKKQKRLEKKANRPSKEEKIAKIKQEITELGFEEQSKKLEELGYTNLARNARLLKKFSGALDDIIKRLQKKAETRENKPKEKKEKAFKLREELKEKVKKERKPKEKLEKVACAEYEIIPESITTIYLDGNNMLFCENEIRRLVLSHKRLEAEKVLSNIAFTYSELT